MVKAWYMDDSANDQRLEHKLNNHSNVPQEQLDQLGVKQWWIDPKSYDTSRTFQDIKQERGYTYEDQITVSPDRLENYEAKIKSFYDEHIHTDEEIRYVLEGSGYFDVRDFEDRWIRIFVTPGDLIVLPAGIYHRFTVDKNNYIKALRLFVGEPIWTPYSRCNIDADHPSVKSYRESFGPSSNRNCVTPKLEA